MQADDALMARAEVVLKQEPLWEPPAGFLTRVVAAAQPAELRPVAPAPVPTFVYAAGAAVFTIALGYAISRFSPEIAPLATLPVVRAINSYEMLLGTATTALVMNSTLAGWISAALSLSLAGLFTEGAYR